MKISLRSDKIIYSFIVLLSGVLLMNNNSYPQDKHNHNKHQMGDSTLEHRQHMIHSESHMVMPFDMNKVTHYFIKNEYGGIITIKVKDEKDTAQIELIRSHLKKEQKLFSKADFRDPKTLHGEEMSGLEVLSGSEGKFDVKYNEIPKGASVTFSSKDSTVVNALHKWFDAQLKDHGSDAKNLGD